MSNNFFFIIRSNKTNTLERILVNADLRNTNLLASNGNIFTNNSLLNSVKELYLNFMVSKTDDEIKTRYITKANQLKIFYKNQLKNIIPVQSDMYTNYSDTEFKDIFQSVSMFFLEEEYKSCTFDSLDKFKVVISPDKFIKFINSNIETAAKINQSIMTKYDYLISLDRALLKKKNEILLSKNVFNFEEILTVLKEREIISYILIDIDADITNILIKCNDLKYRQLFLEDCNFIEILTNLKELINDLEKINTFCKDNYSLLN